MCLAHLGDREVAAADLPDLAGLHQLAHCLHSLLQRRCHIRPVEKVEVYYVGLEPAQTVFGCLHDVVAAEVLLDVVLQFEQLVGGKVVLATAHGQSHLGRDYGLVSARPQSLRQKLLRAPEAVPIRRVKQGNP